MDLRERAQDLAALRRAVEGAASGAGSCVFVTAPPGLGKSALLAHAESIAAELAVGVRATSCHQLEREFPWGAVRELLGVEPAGGGAGDGTLDALRGLLEGVRSRATDAPVVFVVDDLHWCDSASLRFLVYLQQRLGQMPVSLIGAMRSGDSDPNQLLATLTSAPRTEIRTLRPLSPEGVCEIVRDRAWAAADADLCSAIARVTGGNPFYVHELLAELASRVSPPSAGEIATFTPASVGRAVALRLRGLGDPAERLARAVAVLGDDAALSHGAQLAGLDESAAIAAADALAGAEIFAARHPLAFAHPLVRTAVYEEIPMARRAADHLRAASLLAEAGLSDQAASQLLHAPPAGQPWALGLLERAAARAVESASPELAAAFLRRALDEPAGPEERRRLLVALGRAEGASGRPEAAARFAEAAAGTADPVERARVLLMLGWTKHHQGNFAEAAREFQNGLDELGDRDPELATLLELGFFTSGSLDAAYAPEAHARVARLEHELPELPGPAGRALLAQSLTARTFAGEPYRELLPLADRVWAEGRALREDGANAETVWAAIGFWIWSDQYDRALRATEAALAEARRHGSALARARGWYARGWARYWIGDLEDAIADQHAAIEIWRGGMETYLPAAVYWLVLAQLEAGRPADARGALELAGPLARWEGTAFGVFLIAASARVALHEGDATEALRLNRLAGQIATERLAVVNPALLPWRSQAALAALALGDHDAARAYADEALGVTQRFGAPRALAEAQRVAALTQPPTDAAVLLERAAAISAGSGAPVEHARLLVELGSALRRSGRRSDARVHLRSGLELAEQHGAASLAQHARVELAATGVRVAPAPGAQPAALTASEDRVAHLAAAGRTNREIAAALRVSVKAVEFHLHSTYRKLGIRSRRELPGAIGARENAR